MIYDYFDYNKVELLKSIDQIKVWSNIIGKNVVIGEKILNPLRNDKSTGSCSLIRGNNGNIILVDFADKRTSGFDCISAYQYLHPYKRWSEICSELLNEAHSFKPSSYKVIPGIKKVTEFKPFYKEWSDFDLNWWKKRGVYPEQLNRSNTFIKPVEGYSHTRNNKTSEVHFNEQCYCYHHENKVKFYWPNRKEWRFLGNMSKNDVWKIDRNSDTLIISKSHKDLLVLENLTEFDLTHVQSETNYPDKDKFFEWECYYKQIIILMDNDLTGRNNAEEIKKQFLYLPVRIIEIEQETQCKDIDEFFIKNGLQESIDYLNHLLCKN